MAIPRHLRDPLAHEENFKALKEEVDEGLEAALSSMFIPGMVVPFSGAFGGSDGKRPINPHTGKANEEFALCDGGTYKSPTGPMMSTPDMRGRFVIGAGGKYEVGDTGGSEEHEHTLSIDQHTLTLAQMPSHAHTVDRAVTVGEGAVAGLSSGTRFATTMLGVTHDQGSSQPHTHTGNAGKASNLGPYYALAYIMKL